MDEQINIEKESQSVGVAKENYVRLLWTGGWDSTFRLVELSRQEVTVQPTYFYGDGRKSEHYERRAMAEILDLLWKHPKTKAKISPLEDVDIRAITPIKEISDAYHNIIKEHRLGTQYEWIAWYAAINPGCEVCVEKQYLGGTSYMASLINAKGELIETKDIHNYKVESQSKDIMLILGNLYLPTINTMEVDMMKLIKDWGYEDVMKHIWFCHNPIKDKPCGLCRPCAEKMESGMEFLLSESAQRRYRFAKKHEGSITFLVYKAFYRIFLSKKSIKICR